MPAYAISYDLHRPGQNYDDLTEAIQSFGTWWHHLDSTWIVITSLSASEVLNKLRPYLDTNDEMLVTEIGQAAWIGFNDRGSEWLRSNL